MKLLAVLVVTIGVALCEPQRGGFFNQVGAFFGGRGRRPNRPNQNRPQQNRPQQNRPQQQNRPPTRNNRGGCSGEHPTNFNLGGKGYLVSWRVSGCGNAKWSHSGADSWCRQSGMRAVSLDSGSKTQAFLNLVQSDRKPYFWTGGRVNHGANSITWTNGRTTTPGPGRWSHTGGARRPQPDNREGNEFCMGVLNDFYNDGVKFHDISCHHKKPVICE